MTEEKEILDGGRLALALSKAQGEIGNAAKDKTNPFFSSTYATLASVWAACRAALSKYEIAVIQAPVIDDATGKLTLRTTLMHSSGEEWHGEMPVQAAPTATAQQMGSALTYARRYSLASMVGVAPDDDDDGNAATAVPPPKPAYKPKAKLEVIPESGLASVNRIKADATAFVQKLEMSESLPEFEKLMAKNGQLLLDIKNRLPEDWGKRVNDKIDAQIQLLTPQT